MKTRIIRGIGWCILLLLAGCKIEDDTPQVSSDTVDLTQTEGLEMRIAEYDQVTLEYLQTAESLPMSSSYTFNVQDINKDCGTLYVAYAATKFTFTFENQMGVTMPLGVSGITIHQIASTSYLYPHGVDRWLSDLLNKTIISAYDIPDKATHAPFSLEDFERVVIESGATYTFPPIYLTESKNTNEIDKVQSYAASLKIGIGEDGSADHIRDVQLTDGTTPLNSLFRNTHVNVRIVVKRLEQIEIIIGIYGMIEPWVELEPVHGSIVEKS